MFILDKPHSVIDIITNSSTEIFVSVNNKNANFVYRLIQECIKQYNQEMIDLGLDRTTINFDSVFERPYLYTKELYIKTFNENKEWLREHYNIPKCYDIDLKDCLCDFYKDDPETFHPDNYLDEYQTSKYIGCVIVPELDCQNVPGRLGELIMKAGLGWFRI